MKNILLFVLVFYSIYSCNKPPATEQQDDIPDSYELVWAEEFNKEGNVDSLTWNFEHGFVRNEELQWYQEENAHVKNGKLIIEGRRETVENPRYEETSNSWKRNRKTAEYTSSSLNTRGKKEFQYGILKVRAKIDTTKGMWPAIWTLGIDKGWPANGEVDVMEYYMVGNAPHILANAAWRGTEEYVRWDSEKIPFTHFLEQDKNWAAQFHTWTMDWNEERIKLYLDDELLNEIDLSKTTNPGGFNPFHQPHYILLNLAIGSNGGDPSQSAFPKNYQVDYVRLYQKTTGNE